MSRIILEKYHGTDESHLVVGWDLPMGTFYWQEFNKEPEPTEQGGEVNWNDHPDWEEMLGFAGYNFYEFETLGDFVESLPRKFKPYIDEQVRELLTQHQNDPDTGSVIVDLSERSWKAEVIADNLGKWSTNGLRFATEQEAKEYAINLMGRWMLVREYRVSPSGEPANYKWANGKPVKV